MKKFERSILIDKTSYIYRIDDQTITVNKEGITLNNVKVTNPDELQHLAAAIGASYLDHQSLCKGEEKLKPRTEFSAQPLKKKSAIKLIQ